MNANQPVINLFPIPGEPFDVFIARITQLHQDLVDHNLKLHLETLDAGFAIGQKDLEIEALKQQLEAMSIENSYLRKVYEDLYRKVDAVRQGSQSLASGTSENELLNLNQDQNSDRSLNSTSVSSYSIASGPTSSSSNFGSQVPFQIANPPQNLPDSEDVQVVFDLQNQLLPSSPSPAPKTYSQIIAEWKSAKRHISDEVKGFEDSAKYVFNPRGHTIGPQVVPKLISAYLLYNSWKSGRRLRFGERNAEWGKLTENSKNIWKKRFLAVLKEQNAQLGNGWINLKRFKREIKQEPIDQ